MTLPYINGKIARVEPRNARAISFLLPSPATILSFAFRSELITVSCASTSRTDVPGWFPRSRPNSADYNCEALGMHELPWREGSGQRSDCVWPDSAKHISPASWKHSRPWRKRNYAREFIPHARYVP